MSQEQTPHDSAKKEALPDLAVPSKQGGEYAPKPLPGLDLGARASELLALGANTDSLNPGLPSLAPSDHAREASPGAKQVTAEGQIRLLEHIKNVQNVITQILNESLAGSFNDANRLSDYAQRLSSIVAEFRQSPVEGGYELYSDVDELTNLILAAVNDVNLRPKALEKATNLHSRLHVTLR